MEGSTLGFITLGMIALFGFASFCFEMLGRREPQKKKHP